MDKLYSIQTSLYTLYNLLPIITMITFLTIGLGLGNYGMISIGLSEFVISVVVFLLRFVAFRFGGLGGNLTASLTPGEIATRQPSSWLIIVTFLFTAIFINAYRVYQIDPLKNAGSDPNLIAQIDTAPFQSKVSNRKTRCIMIMVLSAVLAILFIGYRVVVVEGIDILTLLFSVLSVGIGLLAGYFWDLLMKQELLGVGLSNMDIFGISQQLISVKQTDLATMCELQPAAKGDSGASCSANGDCKNGLCIQNNCN
jgi:hypothetical protein